MIPVIIPYYKNKHQLDKCIAHLKNQTVAVEIFVRDNNQDNVFFTAAVNEGIRNYLNRNCEFMIVLNQDMYLEPPAVEEMVKFMKAHPLCGIGTPLQVHIDYNDYVVCAGCLEAYPTGNHQHGPAEKFSHNQKIFWANGACLILRKQMVQEIGLLDENLVFIASDSDYSFTARARGWEVWQIARARGVHEDGATKQNLDAKMELLKINDAIYFGKKWLTGDLYKELAYDGPEWNLEKIHRTALKLEEARLEKLRELGQQISDRKQSWKYEEDPAQGPGPHSAASR